MPALTAGHPLVSSPHTSLWLCRLWPQPPSTLSPVNTNCWCSATSGLPSPLLSRHPTGRHTPTPYHPGSAQPHLHCASPASGLPSPLALVPLHPLPSLRPVDAALHMPPSPTHGATCSQYYGTAVPPEPQCTSSWCHPSPWPPYPCLLPHHLPPPLSLFPGHPLAPTHRRTRTRATAARRRTRTRMRRRAATSAPALPAVWTWPSPSPAPRWMWASAC